MIRVCPAFYWWMVWQSVFLAAYQRPGAVHVEKELWKGHGRTPRIGGRVGETWLETAWPGTEPQVYCWLAADYRHGGNMGLGAGPLLPGPCLWYLTAGFLKTPPASHHLPLNLFCAVILN